MSRQDYERAASLWAVTSNKVFRDVVDAHWLDDVLFCYRIKTSANTHETWLVDACTGDKSPCPPDLFLSSTPALPILSPYSMLCSENGVQTDIIFKNYLKKQVCVFWIDWNGKEKEYKVIEGGDNHTQQTYATHAWVVKTSDDQLPICAFKAIEIPAIAPIRDSFTSMETSTLPVLPPTPEPCSANASGETQIIFENNLDEHLRVLWVDSNGIKTEYMVLESGETQALQTYAGHAWLVTTLKDQTPICAFIASEIPSRAPIRDARESQQMWKMPCNKRGSAFVRDGNVGLRGTQFFKSELMLTSHATNACIYRESDLYWSPDGNKLVALQTLNPSVERHIHLVESSPTDQVEPKLHRVKYPKPGDPLLQQRPNLFDAKRHKHIYVSDSLFANAYDLTEPHWEQDSSRFMIVYNQRGHQVLRVIAVDSLTGQTKVIVEETSETFIDYAGKKFVHYLDNTKELLWMSESDGWNHLYLYETRKGVVKNQVTHGEWVVRGIERVDENNREIHFRASDLYPTQDPYHIHYCRVNFDGTGLVMLTEGDGTHSVEFSPSRQFLIDTYSRVDLPPITELRNSSNGSLLITLEVSDVSALQVTPWKVPLRFVAKGRDGHTDIHGVIFRPTNLQTSKKYPVIEEIYAGPQGSNVPKAFSAYHKPQSLAELGFIVVMIDGMGTSNRSKAFHNVCHKNLGDAGLPDRMLWIQAAARKYPYMDTSKVGIYGVSAGGQNALRALLMYPDFYKVGVSASGCHDNRMDKLWWNELWMGWPVGPHYHAQSNVTQAHRLQSKLLLIVCEMDTNVDPASTLQVANALIRADKDFDLVFIPGEEHGLGGAYGERRMQDFFVRHLLGMEPRHV